jgi:hypothetical protein
MIFTLGTSVVSLLIDGLYSYITRNYVDKAVPFDSVEMMGYLERVMSFALTGHPKVICKEGMESLHISLSVIQDGWMSFADAITIEAVSEDFCAPFIDQFVFPRNLDTSPMFATRSMQESVYGRAHAEVSHSQVFQCREPTMVESRRLQAIYAIVSCA